MYPTYDKLGSTVDMNSPVHSSYGSSSREKLGKPKSGTAYCRLSRVFSPSLFFLVKSTLKTSEIHYLREPSLRILRQKLPGRIGMLPIVTNILYLWEGLAFS